MDDFVVLLPTRSFNLIALFACLMLIWWGYNVLFRVSEYLKMRHAAAANLLVHLGSEGPTAQIVNRITPAHLQRLLASLHPENSLALPAVEAPATLGKQVQVRTDESALERGLLRISLDMEIVTQVGCNVQILFGVPDAVFTGLSNGGVQHRNRGSSPRGTHRQMIAPSSSASSASRTAELEMTSYKRSDETHLSTILSSLRGNARFSTGVHHIDAAESSAGVTQFETPDDEVFEISLEDVCDSNGAAFRAERERRPNVATSAHPAAQPLFAAQEGGDAQSEAKNEEKTNPRPQQRRETWTYDSDAPNSLPGAKKIPAVVLLWNFREDGSRGHTGRYSPTFGMRKRKGREGLPKIAGAPIAAASDGRPGTLKPAEASIAAVQVSFSKVEERLEVHDSQLFLLMEDALIRVQEIFGTDGEDDSDECVICFSEKVQVLLVPCRHLCVCSTCFAQIDKCPVCRSEFDGYCEVEGQDRDGPADSTDDVGEEKDHVASTQ